MKKGLLRKVHRDFPLDEVVERDEPNLFRDIFPYSEVCRVPFDGVLLAPAPPEEIWITDTTFRDGQQARAPYTPEQIVTIFKLMHRLGGQKGIIRQSESFLYSDKDKEAVERCQELGYRFPEITGWIRARHEDFLLVKQINALKKKEAPPAAPAAKECPFCFSTVPLKATRCPHCTSELKA